MTKSTLYPFYYKPSLEQGLHKFVRGLSKLHVLKTSPIESAVQRRECWSALRRELVSLLQASWGCGGMPRVNQARQKRCPSSLLADRYGERTRGIGTSFPAVDIASSLLCDVHFSPCLMTTPPGFVAKTWCKSIIIMTCVYGYGTHTTKENATFFMGLMTRRQNWISLSASATLLTWK
jgi:hypothetical protein